MLLAASIPQELFRNILFYMSDASDGKLRRVSEGPSSNDTLAGLKQCSLVSRFWASECRKRLFSGKILVIKCYDDADMLRRYTIQGCARLTPVHQLITRIDVYQGYHQSPFLRLLYLPVIQEKLAWLEIQGPSPHQFNPAKLDTPHWNSPPSIVLPRSFLKHGVNVANLDLPSFHHVTKYISHFSSVTHLNLDGITWKGEMPTSLPYKSDVVSRRQVKAHSMCITTYENKDNLLLALTALMLTWQCPLHRVSDVERACMIAFMDLLWKDRKNPYVRIGECSIGLFAPRDTIGLTSSTFSEYNVSESQRMTKMHLGHNFDFIFEDMPLAHEPTPSLRVAQMHVYIPHFELPNDLKLEALIDHVRSHPSIRVLVLLFGSFWHLHRVMEPYRSDFERANDSLKVVLAYLEPPDHEAVGVDPVTMQPNGVSHHVIFMTVVFTSISVYFNREYSGQHQQYHK